ncbi:MAG TPA: Hpt domain-containing protein [Candidatus Acidoferrales bacterium]|nr:Hpt domain-containing protein [Candidatus Acidoferrales bacterium]
MAIDFDESQLDAITGGDPEFEREIIEEYLASAPRDLQKLKGAVLANDVTATGSFAHGLKGASATIGARGFAAIAFELEQAGKQGDLSRSGATLDRLERAYAELAALLRSRVSKAA